MQKQKKFWIGFQSFFCWWKYIFLLKTIILLYFKKLLNFLWLHKDEISFVFKNYKFDGKVDLKDVAQVIDLYKQSGLQIDEEAEEETFEVGTIEKIEKNTSKNLVLYNQSSWSCVIYAMTRTLMYNSNIILTKDEIEAIKEYARVKGYWIDKRGMTFINGCRAVKEWL